MPLLLAGTSARADAPEGDEIEDVDLVTMLEAPLEVWTATRSAQKSREAPAIITTVTREQIAVWGYRSLSELLSHLLGFYVLDDHTSANLAVRGISGGLYADSSIVKVLIDGQAVAFQSTAGNWLGPELLPLTAIEQVEVMRGPASALFGADAFLGVVSIRTRTGGGINGATVSLAGGRVGQEAATDIDLSAGTERGPLDVLVAARRTSQDLAGLSFLPPPARLEAPGRALSLKQQGVSLMTRIRYRPRPSTDLELHGHLSSLSRSSQLAWSSPGAQTVSPETNRLSLSQLRAGLAWNEALSDELQLAVRGSLFRGGPGHDDRQEVGSDYYYVQRRFAFRGGDLDGQIDWRPDFAAQDGLRLTAGAGLLLDDEQLPSRVAVSKQPDGPPVIEAISIYQGRKIFLNSGAYLQGIWDVRPAWLSVTAGLRYDRHNVYGGQVSERVGLVSNPRPDLHAKLLYGSAFKAPSPTLLYAVPAAVGDVVGNTHLRPQRGRTLELQLAYDPDESVSLSSNVSYGIVSNMTEFVQQGINQVARNVARASTVSWETLGELSYRRLLRGSIGLQTQRTVRQTGQRGYAGWLLGSQGDIYPSFMVHAGAALQPPGLPLRAALTASCVGQRRASDTNILLNRQPYALPGYLLLDATLSTGDLGFRHGISFAVSGKNLLGARGPTPGFSGVDYPLPPRALLLQTNLAL